MVTQENTLLRLPEVENIVGLRRSRIYRMLSDPSNPFPRPVKLGTSSRWSKAELKDWIDARLAERDAPRAA